MDYTYAVPTQPDTLIASRRQVTAGLAELELAAWRSGCITLAAIGASSHAAMSSPTG